MEQKAEQFRNQSKQANQGRRRPGWRYSLGLRQIALSYLEDCLRKGWGPTEAARNLGVSEVTLQRWFKESKGNGSLKHVKIVDRESSTDFVLLTPTGYRVEGLSEESLLRLLGQLR
jgi:hypothetical protein